MADMSGLLIHMLANIGKRGRPEKPTLYSEIAHNWRKKSGTDNMTPEQIIKHIAAKL